MKTPIKRPGRMAPIRHIVRGKCLVCRGSGQRYESTWNSLTGRLESDCFACQGTGYLSIVR